MTATLPSLFVPHGAPTFAMHPGAAGAAMAQCARQLPEVRVVVMVSAHWSEAHTQVGSAAKLETIHDYSGFPHELYNLRYPASGCKEASQEVLKHLQDAGITASLNAHRGLDHGAWVPLHHMFPEADIPVVPVSLTHDTTPAAALALGKALAPLRDQGFLIIGSGSITHNLRDFHVSLMTGGLTPTYVRLFADWVADTLAADQKDPLLSYRTLAPAAVRAHPTEEHLLPLMVALGAAGPHAQAHRFHAGINDHVIAMDAYQFTSH